MKKFLYPVLIVVLAAVSITAGLMTTVSAQLPRPPQVPPTCPAGSVEQRNQFGGDPMAIRCTAPSQCPEGLSPSWDQISAYLATPTCVVTNPPPPPRPTCPTGFTLTPDDVCYGECASPLLATVRRAPECSLTIPRRDGDGR